LLLDFKHSLSLSLSYAFGSSN
jgi:hypothetical protein